MLPLAVKYSRELKKISSMTVAEWSVSLAGYNIWGWKNEEPKAFRKLSVLLWNSIYKRYKLKSN